MLCNIPASIGFISRFTLFSKNLSNVSLISGMYVLPPTKTIFSISSFSISASSSAFFTHIMVKSMNGDIISLYSLRLMAIVLSLKSILTSSNCYNDFFASSHFCFRVTISSMDHMFSFVFSKQ